MEAKRALSSALTLALGLACLVLASLVVARLVWTVDLELEEQSENPSSSEEGERKMTDENEYQGYDDEGVSSVFQDNIDTSTAYCMLGTCPTTGAHSCHEIKEYGQPSGYYWIKTENDTAVQLFCDMTRECCSVSGGWTRAVLLNMSNPTHKCPEQWREITSPRRTCGRTEEDVNSDGAGCSSAIFPTYGQQYHYICGRIVGYQYCNTLAFWSYFHKEGEMTIDDAFVDGVTISHGSAPRQHVWTLAAALHENYGGRDAICQCTKTNYDNKSYRRVRVPPWVGTNYFCETGTSSQPPPTTEQCSLVYEKVFYSMDPLWDGQGCGSTSYCCSFHNPPWFCKELGQPTRDDLEVRICGSTYVSFGDTPVELIELYIN